MKDPFIVKKCVLLVLRPNLFLPEDRPLPINTHRVFRTPGGAPLTGSDEASWVLYYPQYDSPYLADSSDQEFTEFDYESKRRQGQGLSVFSLLVNANSKLQATKQRPGTSADIDDYIYNDKRTVDAIFFVPPWA